MTDAPKSRGCLTAHFTSVIDLDYPCALSTSAAATSNSAAPMAAGIPYVANVTQATLEIRKSRLFVEKHAVYQREQEANKSIIGAANMKRDRKGKQQKKKGDPSHALEAAKEKENAILADPLAVIEGAHFALNALPHIGNTGRPLTICHFFVEKGHIVTSNTAAASSSSSAAAATPVVDAIAKETLAVVRMPIHMCSSVGQQGREEPKKKKPSQLGEGGSFGLAGLELIYVPRRAAKGTAEAKAEEAAEAAERNAFALSKNEEDENDNDDDDDENDDNNNSKKKKKNNFDKNKNNMYNKRPMDNKGKYGKKGDDTDGPKRFVRDVFPAPYFDVTVTIAGVQYTYLMHSQFDVLAGRGGAGATNH